VRASPRKEVPGPGYEATDRAAEKKARRQCVDSPETVSGSAGGSGPRRVMTQLRGDN
jgi:hypothetical protein